VPTTDGTDSQAAGPIRVPEVPAVSVPVLARSAHDRVSHRRTDLGWIEKVWTDPASRVLVLSAGSRTRVLPGPALQLLAPSEVDVVGDRVFLGEASGVAYFAILADPDTSDPDGTDTDTAAESEAVAEWRGLRELAAALDDLDVGLLTAAVALQAWHRSHTHCPRCGAVTEVTKAGWSRVCPVDGSEHFPRTDPAVIMLVRDGRDRCLLARGPIWPPGRMSVLAGFVEAGESAEAAVVREVAEEVGIKIHNVRYVASQPHPFPASLMLGFTADVDGDVTLVPDREEIAEAGWFTREEVRAARDWGHEDPDDRRPLRALPPTMSIARQLIDGWLAEDG
jgi:NAD+ diphosphatase